MKPVVLQRGATRNAPRRQYALAWFVVLLTLSTTCVHLWMQAL